MTRRKVQTVVTGSVTYLWENGKRRNGKDAITSTKQKS